MGKLHKAERKLTAKARTQRGRAAEESAPLNWGDGAGKYVSRAQRRLRGAMGLDQGLESRVGCGFSPWLLREERQKTEETPERPSPGQAEGTGGGRAGEGGRRSVWLVATGMHLKPGSDGVSSSAQR